MFDRSVLGGADVTDAELAAMVATYLGEEEVQLLTCTAEEAPYDLVALTTLGRFRVHGTAHIRRSGDVRPYKLYVKAVQSFERSPLFATVPPQLREAALRLVPWRSEPEVYRGDLASALPPGLSMPRHLRVAVLDEKSEAIWLEEVDVDPGPWDLARHIDAARLLGRFAASASVRTCAVRIGPYGRSLPGYVNGRLATMVFPALMGDKLWRRPAVALTFDPELRDRIRSAVADVQRLLAELEIVPVCTAHGDACTRNLLVRPGVPGFTLIDFGFFGPAPLGTDLGQLVVGEVQLGERDSGELAALEDGCFTAYMEGVRAEA